ncbi:hypothetical protein V5O48_011883, partial [Marasmius crinis-equi]
MAFARSFTLLLSLTSVVNTLAGQVQKPDLVLPPSAAGNRDAVKDIFERSYNAYKKFAFGHDDLMPLTGGFNDGRNGWGASMVDAMSTMSIMGLDDFFNEAVLFAGTIDFSKSQTNDTVSVFETTIRYLGGLLSAYELSGKQHSILLEKAKEVADKMAFAWTGSVRSILAPKETQTLIRLPTPFQNQSVPFGHLNFASNQPVVGTSNIAEAGTLDLEWATLTKYTGNATYERLTVDSVRTIATNPAPLPALAPQGINPTNGKSIGNLITWGGGSDSYLEYLIKYARLSNTNDDLFADTWATAVDSSIRFILRQSTVGNYTYLVDRDGTAEDFTIDGVSSHLACFNGGNWIYGGRLLNNETIVSIGLDLTDACWNTYASTATGIGPEVFRFNTTVQSDQSNHLILTDEQRTFYDNHGFYITGTDYILRPEVLESNFYAWRVTGDTKYLDRAASAVDSFNKFLVAEKTGGFAGLMDVSDPLKGQSDDTESFWFAEVLKYLYLTFDDPKHISLDEYVFNTEAHPFIAPAPKSVYGSGNLLTPSDS